MQDTPHPIDVHVGARIRLRRQMRGLSQRALAEVVEVTFQQIQKYESGANRIGAGRLHDIAVALDVPVAWLFEDQGDPTAIGVAEPGSGWTPEGGGPGTGREHADLLHAFYTIPDPEVRRRVIDLMRALGAALSRQEGDEGERP